MVAWHEVPGMRKKKEPVPEGRCDYVFARWSRKIVLACAKFGRKSTAAPAHSSCPSGTNRIFFTPFLALRARLLSCVPPGQ